MLHRDDFNVISEPDRVHTVSYVKGSVFAVLMSYRSYGVLTGFVN